MVPPKIQPPAARLVWGLKSIAEQSQLLHIRWQRSIFGTEQFLQATNIQNMSEWLKMVTVEQKISSTVVSTQIGYEPHIDTSLETLQWLARRRLTGLLVGPWARPRPCAECGGGGLVRWWSGEQRRWVREICSCHSHSNSSLLSETVPGSRITGIGNSNFHFQGKFEASESVCCYRNLKQKIFKRDRRLLVRTGPTLGHKRNRNVFSMSK